MEQNPRKRTSVLVTGKYLHARDVEQYLKENGVDVKVVTKHAVQVHPDHVSKVDRLVKNYRDWVERKIERVTNEGIANRGVRESSAEVA